MGNSNAARAHEIFVTKDHALQKERKIIRCTSAMAFKLQVRKKCSIFNIKGRRTQKFVRPVRPYEYSGPCTIALRVRAPNKNTDFIMLQFDVTSFIS